MTIEYLDLADYVAIAASVTGLDVATLMKVTSLGLADSALHAPAASFGDTEFYPDFVDKAAVLIVRLARNHPCRTATSGLPGWRFDCSSTSTRGTGSPSRPSTPLRQQCWRLPPASGTRQLWQTGSAAISNPWPHQNHERDGSADRRLPREC